jgi:murein DD-endopeptidase MepM/ murein hydrolase activator NlpD
VNYSTFLNKNSKFKNINRYTLSDKKKKKHIFLLNAFASFIFIFSVAVFVVRYDFAPKTELTNTGTASHTREQTSLLELPVIGNQSDISSEVVVSKTADNQILNDITTSKIDINLVTGTEKNAPVKQAIQTTSLEKNARVSTKGIEKKHLLTLAEENITNINSTPTIKQAHSKTIKVKKGDTLSVIFKRHSLSSNTLYKIINSGKHAKRLTRIKPGQTITINFTPENKNKIESLLFAFNKVETLVINKKDNQFTSHIDTKEIDIKQQFASETIRNSLFSAGNKAGLSNSMIMKLAQLFGWDIDFALDIRKGDSFAVLFEEKYIDGKKFSNGNILSAEFVNQGKTFKAIRFTDKSGHTDYYSEKGLSMRKAFLRTPVEFSRISSRFSNGRKHPVLNRIRAHRGVDYAASRGTPIKSVGDGKVIFKGKKGGYGKVVILQHGSKYTTLYAHMNSYNRKIKHGSRIKQGQIIGYVGSSGLATGPHLHYEFRLNGVHRNPLTVPLPSAAPIAKKYRSDFQAVSETLISQLKSRKQETIALKSE